MHNLALLFGKSAFVLSEKNFNNEGPCFVHLKARKAGLLNFLATLLGISSSITIDITKDHITMMEKNLSGQLTDVTPITKICNFGYGYTKPILLLIMGFIVLMGSGFWAFMSALWFFLPGLLVALLFLLFYHLQKSMCIYWTSDGGTQGGVLVKRSVIERKSLSEAEAKQICDIVNQLILYANQKD